MSEQSLVTGIADLTDRIRCQDNHIRHLEQGLMLERRARALRTIRP
ncbi:hypothetical protein [Streptomyces sp. NPDC058644]